MTTRTFPEQLTDMWRTRPVRLPEQGHVAGVCAGIGVRYGIDPVLVRIAFVVSALFGGAGIVLYLAAWVLFTRHGDQVSAIESLVGRGHSSDSSSKVIVLLVALAIAASAVGPVGVGSGGSGFISMVLMLGGWWLLYQRRPDPPTLPPPANGFSFHRNMFPPQPFGQPFQTHFGQTPFTEPTFTQPPQSPFVSEPTTAQRDAAGGATDGPGNSDPGNGSPQNDSTVSLSKDAPESDDTAQVQDRPLDTGSATPPAWDPLGVAPFAWDLPEPAPTHSPVPVEKKPRSRLTTMILGFAVLAAAAAGTVAVSTDIQWLTPARIGAIALAVIGLGLLLGAFLHRGYGLLVVTGPLMGFVILGSLVGPLDIQSSGEQRFAPLTAAELGSEYSVQLGDLQLDLKNLELTQDHEISIDTRLGDSQIFLPPNLDVDITCNSTAASPCTMQGFDGGADGPGGPVLSIDIDTVMGNTEVHRG
ncbi:phage shock protein C (PspC) family protein [Rhodococcus sp. SMB37]|uniref:PspC domain-containing protein n=1 Tax=Rhodococcus sp. SMB37 TaxID=2512213 RepID=UPI001044F0A5|nr:PspC domain-containing protein [Rhodococcus sp. SMB37]TCN57260.1 phage shock protein C (PspC) family protein [Rhodococcus sp. SMB37]